MPRRHGFSYSRGIMEYYLTSVGDLRRKRKKLWVCGVCSSLLMLLQQTLYFIYVEENSFLRAKNIFYLVFSVYYNFIFIFSCHKKNNIKRMLAIFDRGFYQYSTDTKEKNGRDPVEEASKKVVIILLTIIIVSCSWLFLYPSIKIILFHGVYTTTENLICAAWYPWLPFSMPEYFLMYIIQLGQCIPVLFYSNSNFIFVFYFIFEIRNQTKKLCKALEYIPKVPRCKEKTENIQPSTSQLTRIGEIEYRRTSLPKPEKWVKLLNSRMEMRSPKTIVKLLTAEKSIPQFKKAVDVEENAIKHLKECIKHHQVIIEFINCYLSSQQIPFLALLIKTVITCALTILNVLRFHDPFQIYVFLLSGGYIFCIFFYYSYLGEVLKEINNNIQDALYDTEWHANSPQFRRYIYTMMLRCQRGFKLKAIGLFVAGYELFAIVTRLIHSLTSLLVRS